MELARKYQIINHINQNLAKLRHRSKEIKSLVDTTRLNQQSYVNRITKNNSDLVIWQAIIDWKEILDWDYSLKTYKDEIFKYTNLNSNDITYHLFSPGASGSRAIAEHYNIGAPHYCTTGLRKGHSAHIIDPAYVFPQKNFKGIYITSHPIDYIISHYLSGAITGGDSPIMSGGNAMANFLFLFQYDIREPNLQNINRFFDQYINNGVDFFMLKDHIKNWSDHESIESIKYKDFKEKEKQINMFLNKESDYPELVWKKRNSKRDYLSADVLKRLTVMYAEAIEEHGKIGTNNRFIL